MTVMPASIGTIPLMKHKHPILRKVLPLAGLLTVIPFVAGSSYELRVAAVLWIMALAAVGLHLLMGLAGQISLGHAGFFGIGAYAVAILPTRYGWPTSLSICAGIAASALIAYVVGKPILRLKGHYLAIATLGFSLLIGLAITSETALTGGPDGMSVEQFHVGSFEVSSTLAWYVISAVLLAVGTIIALGLRLSPTGRALCSILDSEVAAAAMGVNVAKRKVQVFVIAAIYAAISGSTLALMNGFITPEVAGFMTSVEFVAMVVIGGLSTPIGAIVGAALLTLLPQFLASFHDYQDIAIGLVIMLSMIFLRRGIVPTVIQALQRGAK